jgi:hypothetical protein
MKDDKVDIISKTSTQIGGVTVNFTVGRIKPQQRGCPKCPDYIGKCPCCGSERPGPDNGWKE